MSYYGKVFVQNLQEMRIAHRDFRLSQECVRSSLAKVRDEMSAEEYAIIHARVNMDIATPPESMRRIAKALKKNGLKDTEVTRQRVEQVIRNTIVRLGEIDTKKAKQNEVSQIKKQQADRRLAKRRDRFSSARFAPA